MTFTVYCTERLDGEAEPRTISRTELATEAEARAAYQADIEHLVQSGWTVNVDGPNTAAAFGTTVRRLYLVPRPIDLGCMPQYDDDLPPRLQAAAFAFHSATCGTLGDACYVTASQEEVLPGYHLEVTVDYANGPDDLDRDGAIQWLRQVSGRLDGTVWAATIIEVDSHPLPFMVVRHRPTAPDPKATIIEHLDLGR